MARYQRAGAQGYLAGGAISCVYSAGLPSSTICPVVMTIDDVCIIHLVGLACRSRAGGWGGKWGRALLEILAPN